MLFRCDFSQNFRVYFARLKYDTTAFVEQLLADVRAGVIPSIVECARNDAGGEFEGAFSKVCRERCIKQEITAADSPEYKGVAERRIAMMEAAVMVARGDADRECGVDVPGSLWA